jgi:hypothetical protein
MRKGVRQLYNAVIKFVSSYIILNLRASNSYSIPTCLFRKIFLHLNPFLSLHSLGRHLRLNTARHIHRHEPNYHRHAN